MGKRNRNKQIFVVCGLITLWMFASLVVLGEENVDLPINIPFFPSNASSPSSSPLQPSPSPTSSPSSFPSTTTLTLPLHTEGRYIKDSVGNIIVLKGAAIIECEYNIDKLKNGHTIAQRVSQLKTYGVNCVRLQINKANWDSNLDTNGDGVGNRDFTVAMAQALSDNGIMVLPGVQSGNPEPWDKYAWANWYCNNVIPEFEDITGFIGVYVINEPHSSNEYWGGTTVDTIRTGYWEAQKYVCQQIHQKYPNLLMVCYASSWSKWAFNSILRTDPITTPNVVYTLHYYYYYAPALDPYDGWLTGVLDPDYSYLTIKGMPFYASYYAGNLATAKQQFEQFLYNQWFWVPAELNLPIISDEFGFTGNERDYFEYRACATCLANNDGAVQSGVTFWKVSECYADSARTQVFQKPYVGTCYDPTYGHALPQPREDAEPGWPNCMMDFISLMNTHTSGWLYFGLWGSGYGLFEDDMVTLSPQGDVWRQML